MVDSLFKDVLENFLQEKIRPFKGNKLANKLRHDLPDAIREKSYLQDEYHVKGSPGSGGWAEIPWIAMLDKGITITPEKGFYVVYLFDANMKGVYLSLNQGWVQYEKRFGNNQSQARSAIHKNTLLLQGQLKSTYGFSTAPIDLHAQNTLGKGYELGHICGKYHPKSSFPSDAKLFDDLRNMIGVYRELKGLVGTDIMSLEKPNEQNSDSSILQTSDFIVLENMSIKDSPSNKDLEITDTILSKGNPEDILREFEQRLRNESPKEVEYKVRCLKRNQTIVKKMKEKYKNKCQICGFTFQKKNGAYYSEVAHIKPIETREKGVDAPSNLMVMCPNHHKMLDLGNLKIINSSMYEMNGAAHKLMKTLFN